METIKTTEALAKELATLTHEVTVYAAKCAEISVAIEHVDGDEPIKPLYTRYYYTEGKNVSFVDVRTPPDTMQLRLKRDLERTRAEMKRYIGRINEIINELKEIENNEAQGL